MGLTFDYEGTTYFLEYDRKSVELAENILDLAMTDVRDYRISTMKKLFHGALLKHHPRIKAATVDMLYDLQTDKSGLHEDLLEMYSDTINTLMSSEPEEGKAITRKRI